MFSSSGKLKFVDKKINHKDKAWKILIVDDEEGVLIITKTVLSSFVF